MTKLTELTKLTGGVRGGFCLVSHLTIDKIDKIDKITGGWEQDFVELAPPPPLELTKLQGVAEHLVELSTPLN